MTKTTLNCALIGLVGGLGLGAGGCFSPSDGTLDTDAATDGSSGSATAPSSTTGVPEDEDEDGTSSSTSTTDGSGDSTTSEVTTGPPADTAEVRVIHASSDAGAVDVYIAGDDEPVITNLDYTATSPWLEVPTGPLTVEVRPTGAAADSEPVYTSAPLTLAEGTRVSAIAAGLLGGIDDEAFRILPLEEGWGNALADQARIRVVHAGTDAPSIDLDVDIDENNLVPLDRYMDSAAEGFGISADAAVRIGVRAGAELVTSFTTPSLPEGDELIVIAAGQLGSLAREDAGFALIAVGGEGTVSVIRQDPELFTLHGSLDAGAIETCIGSTELAANVNYGEVQRARMSPGTYDVDMYNYPAGCTGTPLNSDGNSTGMLAAGERYLVLATGEAFPEASEPPVQVVTLRDRFALDEPDAASVRFVHGASAISIIIGSVTGGVIEAMSILASDLEWRDESDEVTLQELEFQIGIAPDDGAIPPLTPIADFHFPANGGARQWAIIAGDPSPEAGDGPLQLVAIDTATPGWPVTITDMN